MISQSNRGIPPAPRFHAEPPRGFALDVPAKEGDPNVFNFNQPRVRTGSLTEFTTDVPRSVTRHSPDGFAWGYAGSGAQELALNILNYVFPPGSDGHEPVLAGDRYVSFTAERLYGCFTQEFVTKIPREQPFQIRREEVERWAREKAKDLGDDVRLPNFFSSPTLTPLERRAHLTPPPQLTNQPATRTDQSSSSHYTAWDRARPELASHNVHMLGAISEYVLDLKKQSAALHGDKMSRQRHFYSELIELGRLVHALDVELFRAAERGVAHNLAHILQKMPDKLRPLFETFIGLIDKESAEVRSWFDSIGVQRVAAEVMYKQVADGISVIPYGPSLMIACSNSDAWISVNDRIRGIGSSKCGGFCCFVGIEGRPMLITAVPTYDMNICTIEGQSWKRRISIHEREHVAQRLRQCGTYDDSFIETSQPKEEVKKVIFQSYVWSMRAEFLAYGLSADWNYAAREALLARGFSRGNGGLYDYPRMDREFWMNELQKMLPEMSDQEHGELLASVAKEYYSWLNKLVQESRKLCSSQHQGAHHSIRALDFLSPHTWPRHIARMNELGLLSKQR